MTPFARLIEIFRLAKRPIVVFDFETAGMRNDPEKKENVPLPPCEFAMVVLGAEEDSDDEVTAGVSEALGMPVSYAVTARVNPGCPMSPGAQATHGISDADVADCPPFDDPEIVGLFRAFEDMGAVWCGHNIADFDIPCALRSGYLRSTPLMIDTMRIARRLQSDEPRPDTSIDGALATMPAASGLDLFRANLTGLHYALTGSRFEGAHSALDDVIATVRVLEGLIDGWIPNALMIKIQTEAVDIEQASRDIVQYLNVPPREQVGWDGWLRAHTVDGETFYEFTKGKHRGSLLRYVRRADRSYIDWLTGPKGPTLDPSTLTIMLDNKQPSIPF